MPWVYIPASRPNGTLYVGVTNDLIRRIHEHKTNAVQGFTRRYGIKTLVYFEIHERMDEAIAREKTMKRWRRAWKLELIERNNPTWRDLYPDSAV